MDERRFTAVKLCLFTLLGCLAPTLVHAFPEDVESGKVCAKCHDDRHAIWQTKHGTKADTRTPAANGGCTACHGDPTEHLKSSSNPMPRRFSQMGAEDKNAVCGTCHKGRNRIHWPGSAHARNDVACVNCHQVHLAKDPVRDKLTQPEVCFSCHKEQRVQISRQSRHPIKEGKVVCSDCHAPHGSAGPKMMVRDSVNDTCYTCHMEKRGPFVRTHQPVTEDCSICHAPHGSTISNLLKWRPPFLCQQCHEPTSHRGGIPSVTAGAFGTTGRGATLARACLNCHTNIHGTNNPADISNERTFRR